MALDFFDSFCLDFCHPFFKWLNKEMCFFYINNSIQSFLYMAKICSKHGIQKVHSKQLFCLVDFQHYVQKNITK